MKFADINSLAVIAYTVLMIGFVVLIIAFKLTGKSSKR